MSLVFRQVGVYLKAAVGVVIAVFLLVFYFANRGNTADIWLLKQFKDQSAVSTNLVVFVSLAAGVLLWWWGWWIAALPGQWRTMHRDVLRRDLPGDQDDRRR